MGQQIHWFPGHMNKALNEVENKVKLVDVVIELLDARAPLSSINENLEKLIQNKKKLIVLTKIDLADQNATKVWVEELKKKYDSILTLDLKNNGAEAILSKAVINLGKDKWAKEMAKGMKPQPIRAMIIGIPNVGKSSTPGILPMSYENQKKAAHLALIGSIREEILPNETLGEMLLDYLANQYPSALFDRYGIEKVTDRITVLNQIAERRKLVDSIGQNDLLRAEALLLKEFKDGLLGKITLEKYGA